MLITALCTAREAMAQRAVMTSDIDSVIIRENRIQSTHSKQNRNIYIMDKAQIRSLPVKTTTELLGYIAGVDLRQRGPVGVQADVAIQGSTFDQVQVLIDGVKMSDPQTGHNMMNLPIPISSIDHIEVMYGPAARIYGINALAGAINIVTRTPQENEVTAQVYSGTSFKKDSATGNTYFGWGAQATATLATGNTAHMLSIAHDEGNGYRYNTDYNAYRAMYKGRFDINSKNRIDVLGGFATNTFGANAFYAAPADANSKEKTENILGSISYTYHPTDRFTITPRISYRHVEDDYIFVKQNPALYHNIHKTDILTTEVQSALRIGGGVLGIGIEYRNEGINSSNLGTHKRNNLGTYAEYKYNFTEDFSASAGIYANYNSDFSWEVLPSIDLGYRFAKYFKVFAQASTGQRLPTFTDLYYTQATAFQGNPNLQPEYTRYAEGGIQYSHRSLFAQASYFYRRTNDFIAWVRSTTIPNDPWTPENKVRLNTSGLMLQANYKLNRDLNISDRYTIGLNASYTYLDQNIINPAGETSNYAIQAFRHQAVLSIRTLLFYKLTFNVNLRHLQRYSFNNYDLLDARIGYDWKHWGLYADVNNILDAQYREIGAVPLPGRWFTLGARLNLNWK